MFAQTTFLRNGSWIWKSWRCQNDIKKTNPIIVLDPHVQISISSPWGGGGGGCIYINHHEQNWGEENKCLCSRCLVICCDRICFNATLWSHTLTCRHQRKRSCTVNRSLICLVLNDPAWSFEKKEIGDEMISWVAKRKKTSKK